jgi:DNA-binding transcriptional MerR regulator
LAKENVEATFNLKAVVRETGLKPDTLRAWERRYGLPEPGRTEGGHRLFSRRDIETLKWLSARQDEGLSISRAVDLWRTLEARQKDPLLAMPYGAGAGSAEVQFSGGEAINTLRAAWIQACRDFDEDQAEAVLNEAFGRFSPETVCLELLVAGLSKIGDDWYQGDFTVQQEHFASALAIRRVEALIASAPQPTQSGVALIACPPDDQHIFSLLVLTFLLRRQGHRAYFLGADVPLAQFETALDATRPDLVIMSAQGLSAAAALLDFGHLLAERGTPLGFGGHVFNQRPGLAERIPGHWLSEKLQDAPQAVERILKIRPKPPEIPPVPEELSLAYNAIKKAQAAFTARVVKDFEEADIKTGELATANKHITQDLLGALHLGDIELLSFDNEWIGGLLANMSMPPGLLHEYLAAYAAALKEVVGRPASVVTDYLETRLVEINPD